MYGACFPSFSRLVRRRKEQLTWSLLWKGTLSKILIRYFCIGRAKFTALCPQSFHWRVRRISKILINSQRLWKETWVPPADPAFSGLCEKFKNTVGLIEKAKVKTPKAPGADEETAEKWARGISRESSMLQRHQGVGEAEQVAGSITGMEVKSWSLSPSR